MQIIYVPQSALQQQRESFYSGLRAQRQMMPLQMLVCDPDSPHCGYGGVDTSAEAYANASPLAIINEQCTKEHRCAM